MSSNIYTHTHIYIYSWLKPALPHTRHVRFEFSRRLLSSTIRSTIRYSCKSSGVEGKRRVGRKAEGGNWCNSNRRSLPFHERRYSIIRYIFVIFLFRFERLAFSIVVRKLFVRSVFESSYNVNRYVKTQDGRIIAIVSISRRGSRCNRTWKSQVLRRTWSLDREKDGQGSKGRERGEKSRPIDGILNLFSAINRIAGKWICNDIYRSEADRGGGTKKERGKGISNLKSLFEIPRNSKNDFWHPSP